VGERWGEEWGSAWFRGTIRIPKSCAGKRVYFRMMTWTEMLLFLDKKPFAGMDVFHQEVLLTPKATGGERFKIDVEAYAGHRHPEADPGNPILVWRQSINHEGHPVPLALEASALVVERPETAGLHYDADVLLATAKMLDENSMRRAQILDTLNTTLDSVPFHPVNDDALETACRAARKRIAPLLKQTNSATTPHVGMVGHTHIDVGWLWRVRESIRKSARTFSTFLRLQEDYPKLTFLQSQPKLLEMVENHYPGLIPDIQNAVKKGWWQPNGGMWVEADCNVTSGESLVRQFLEGRKMTKRLFGYVSDTLWLPDVFGYSAALPQILKLSGIDNFVTSKINWNDTNRFPYDTFAWEGIDGTSIFTHYITSRLGGYNADVRPEFSKESWDQVQLKEAQDSVVASVGYGDGGGGVTREMCERAKRMEDLEGCPRTTWVDLTAFLTRLREQDVARPRWVGELYLELHRGTYTTQARTKRYNRKLEYLLRDVEFLSVLAMGAGRAYPGADLQAHWRTLLTNQFHDIIPGSSIREVYEDAEAEYADMERALGDLRDAALEGKQRAAKGACTVTNSLSWAREDIVALDGEGTVTDAEGAPVPSQIGGGRTYALVKMAPMSVSSVTLTKGKAQAVAAPFVLKGNTLRTPFYRVRFDKAGKISSLVDVAAKREIVQAGRCLNDIYTAQDTPGNWDAWDIDRFYRDTVHSENELVSREVLGNGPLGIVIRSVYAIGEKSILTQDMEFYAHTKRIDFRTKVDWHETHRILKVGFPVDVHTNSCRCEIQFGHLVRPTHANTSWDRARFEMCAHKWVDLSEPGYGVAVLNDCKYGHDTLDNMVSVTLLKSPMGPDGKADRGMQEFTYALLPHDGDFSVEGVVRPAYELNVPLGARCGASAIADGVSFCHVSHPNLIVEAMKKAEKDDAIIVRLYEAAGSRGEATLNFGGKVKKAYVCNLMEENGSAAKVKNDSINFTFRPFEIKTFKVYLA
jgi:alpha-mannosidase